jgi:hypothetical protein
VYAGERAELRAQQLEAAVEQARKKLTQAEQQLHAWRQGAEGERRTGAVLAALEAQGWAILHDLHWPGRPFANIDHIAVGPTGVYVIDSKNWSGQVEVRGGILRQNGYSRQGECQGVASAAAAVAAFLEPQHRASTTAVLCLVGRPTPAEQPPTVRVIGLDDLSSTLNRGVPRISPDDVARVGHQLRQLLDGSRSPEQKTTAIFDSLGTAPREASARERRRTRSGGARSRTTAGRGRVQAGRRADSRGRRLIVPMVKFAVVLAMALYVAPRALHAFTESLEPPRSRTTPTVVTPHAPAPAVTKKSTATPRPKPTTR